MTEINEGAAGAGSKVQRIAVLGAGMGSLSAVYWLTSQPNWKERFDITVYQLGWRLGGKAASGRDQNYFNRNMEHGYHVLLGFYQNAFRTMHDCYRELGRDRSQPLSAFYAPTVADERANPGRYAVLRHGTMTIALPFGDEVKFFPLSLPVTDGAPDDGKIDFDPWQALVSMIDQLWEFATGDQWRVDEALSPPGPSLWPNHLLGHLFDMAGLAEESADDWISHGHPLSAARAMIKTLARMRPFDHLYQGIVKGIVGLLRLYMKFLWGALSPFIDTHFTAYFSWIVQDMAISVICGLLEDDVFWKGFDAINDRNFIDWWMSHGSVPEGTAVTARSALASLPYDLVFGYRGGDSTSPITPEKPYVGQPDMGAGTMIQGMMRFGLHYRGAPEWMFQAGCGEVLVAPIYEVLQKRGVKVEFFSRINQLHLDDTGTQIGSIDLWRQATVKAPPYQPLVEINGVPCWPSAPLYDQLVEGEELQARHINLESHWTDWLGTPYSLKLGDDYDLVLLGISIGALKAITPELAAKSPRWQSMLDNIKTNRPFVLQTWFTPTLQELGWQHGSSINGDTYYQPFNLLASMEGILHHENWPEGGPQTLIYYSGVLPDDPHQPPAPDPAYPPTQHRAMRSASANFLSNRASIYLPNTITSGGFDWSVLQSIKAPSAQGEARLDQQFWRLNIDPSERYVLSVAGSGQYRLAAGDSGFKNLFLAGDWIKIGFDCGCMEATVMSGMQASRAISGYPQHIPGEHSWA